MPVLMLAIILSLVTVPTWGQTRSIEEPPLEKKMGWSLLPNGLLVVEYDLDGNGKADFFAVRVVESHYFSSDDIRRVKGNYPAARVFHVAYEMDNYIYVAARSPLFYAIDSNEDGIWDLVYKDESEDGFNGNEKFYDNPSGSSKPEGEPGVK